MASLKGFNSWRAIALTEEASYDSAATIGDTSFTDNHESDPIVPVATLEDGTILVGSAAEEADEQDVLAWACEGMHEGRCRPNTLAILAAFCLGNISHANDGGYYQHTITPHPKTFLDGAYTAGVSTDVKVDDTGCFPTTGTLIFEDDAEEWAYTSKTATAFDAATLPSNNHADNTPVHLKEDINTSSLFVLPSMTVLDCIGGSVKKQWAGVIVNSLTLSAERKGWVRISASLIGSGTATSPETSRPTPITDESYLKAGDCTVKVSGTWNGRTWSGGTSINAMIRSFSWTFNNNVDDVADYLFGGDLYRERAERGRRTQDLSLELEIADLTWLTYLTAQTNLNLIVDIDASGNYGGQLVFPQLKVGSLARSGGTGILLESAGMEVQQHSTYSSVQLAVYNAKTGYLH